MTGSNLERGLTQMALKGVLREDYRSIRLEGLDLVPMIGKVSARTLPELADAQAVPVGSLDEVVRRTYNLS